MNLEHFPNKKFKVKYVAQNTVTGSLRVITFCYGFVKIENEFGIWNLDNWMLPILDFEIVGEL